MAMREGGRDNLGELFDPRKDALNPNGLTASQRSSSLIPQSVAQGNKKLHTVRIIQYCCPLLYQITLNACLHASIHLHTQG